MAERERTYFCIDMKTFYASVECAERNYNPFETNLVVADITRGSNALCLAITPKLKAMGIRNRCRLSEIPCGVKYEIAPPRMALYIKYAADIYSLYLDYFSPNDIHVYSIDESFIDATQYMDIYKLTPVDFAKRLIDEIADRFHIPATAGVGTNLYLAKIALDITAKHSKNHIGYLDEKLYRQTLWYHRPITDFWMVAGGTAGRLERLGTFDMHGITVIPEEILYKTFGKNAELLIDHAWGREDCLISDIKNYKSKEKSVSFSQILPRDYSFDEARTVMREMILHGCSELVKRRVITRKIHIYIGYSKSEIPPSEASVKLDFATNLRSKIGPAVLKQYDLTVNRFVAIRRMGISFCGICDEECEGYDLFTDFDAVQKEKDLDRSVLKIREKFGKSSLMNAVNFFPEATQKERNGFIGGHRAGYNDT